VIDALRKAERKDRPLMIAKWMRDQSAMRALSTSDDREAVLLEVSTLVSRDTAASLRRKARPAKPEEVKQGEAPQQCPLADTATDAPDLPTPAGYSYSVDGVWRLTEDGPLLVARRPIAITGRYRDTDTGHASVRIGWSEDGAWTSTLVPREVVADGRSLVKLAGQGAPVVSSTSSALAIFLAEQEHCSGLPVLRSTSRCGWHGDSYQAGHLTIGGAALAMMPEDAVAPLADSVHVAGSWEGWCETIRAVSHLPHVYLAIYTALASCCMHPCGVDVGAVVSVVGRRQTGKSTVLKVGASVWGKPSEVGGLIRSWDSTAYHIEQAAALSCDVGLMLDETSRVRAQHADTVPQMIYTLANGGGRGRGTERARSWRVVAMSTGEAPLRSYGGQEGAASRTIEVTGDPMPSASAAQDVEHGIDEHYGHLGPRVIERLQTRPQQKLRTWYRDRVRRIQAQHPGHARAAKIVALLRFAAANAHRVGLPEPTVDVWAWVWSHIDDHASASDQAARAWDVYQARRAGEIAANRWPAEQPVPAEHVRTWLAAAGLVPGAMIAEWRDRGWVGTSAGGRLARVSIGGRRLYCIVHTAASPGGGE